MASIRPSSTFAFSDEELLDALTTFDDVGDFPSLDRLAHTQPALGSFGSIDPSMMPASVANDFLSLASKKHIVGDVDDSASTDSSSELCSTVDESTLTENGSPTRNVNGKPSRKRRKHELDAMRELAATLESQLSSLKQRHHQERPGTSNMFWKRVADQLLLDRQRAMAEKARLQDILEDQAKVLKSIQRSIQKSPDLVKLGVAPANEQPLSISESPDVYNRLFQDVADAYSGTETVLEKAGVYKEADNRRRVNMDLRTEDGRSVMTMEVAESRVVPFDPISLGDGVWRFLGQSSCSGGTSEAFKRSFKAEGDDAFGVVKIGCDLGLFTLTGDVAVRRFIDGRRLTFVWECLGRCDYEAEPDKSFRLQEKGWVVFEPSASDPTKKSVFRSCVQFVPQPLDPSKELSSLAKDVGIATEIVLKVYEKTIGTMYDSIVGNLMGDLSIS